MELDFIFHLDVISCRLGFVVVYRTWIFVVLYLLHLLNPEHALSRNELRDKGWKKAGVRQASRLGSREVGYKMPKDTTWILQVEQKAQKKIQDGSFFVDKHLYS